MTRNPFRLGLLSIALLCAPLRAGDEKELRELLRDALYTEEVTRDSEAAAKQYEELLSRHDDQRAFAASALFRLAEVRRKQDRKEEAIALYQKLLARFPEAEVEGKLAREHLTTLGSAPPANGTPAPAQPSFWDNELKRLKALAESSPDQLRDPNTFRNAIQDERVEAVEYLLSQGADPNTPGALAIAAERGSLGMCKLLLGKGKPSPEEAGKALAMAIYNDRLVVLTYLLDQKLDPNAPVQQSLGTLESPLTWAVSQGKLKAATLLLDHAADVHFMMESKDSQSLSNPFGTALHVAVISEQVGLEMIRLLLKRGADPNIAVPESGLTPLHFAAYRKGPDSDEIVKELLAHGADPNRKSIVKPPGQNTFDRERQAFAFATPFEVALRTEAAGKVDAMLAKGVDLNLHDPDGRTLLTSALLNKNTDRMAWLLRLKADPDVANADGSTPLGLAVHGADLEAARLLLEAGADPNKTSVGLHPLKLAAKRDLIDLLLSKGAKPDASALKDAISSSKWDLVLKMLEAGAPLPEAPESYPWQAPLVLALQSSVGQPAFEKMIAMGAKLDEEWIKSGFRDNYFQYLGGHSPISAYRLPQLFRTFMLPRMERTDDIRMVIHTPAGISVSVLEDTKATSSSPRPLAELLVEPNQSQPWSTRILPSDRLIVWRKDGGEWKTVDQFALGGDIPFPTVQAGDLIELSDDPDAKGRPDEMRAKPNLSPELKWSLRKRVSFPVTVELDGKEQEVTLRGDRLVFDPAVPGVVPLGGARRVMQFLWRPEIDLQDFSPTGPGMILEKVEVVVRRKGWPDIRLPFSATGKDFPLKAGDRLSIEMPEIRATDVARRRKDRVMVKAADGSLVRHFGKFYVNTSAPDPRTVPTLLQAVAEVTQVPRMQEAPRDASALPAWLVEQDWLLSYLQRPDLSKIRIRRLQEDGTEKTIDIDLTQIIAATPEEATVEDVRKADITLQGGDIVEIPVLPADEAKPWTGLTPREDAFFSKALSCRIQVTNSSGDIRVEEVRFRAPSILQTEAGPIPLPVAESVSSPKGTAISDYGVDPKVSREGLAEVGIPPAELFLKEGDRLAFPRPQRAPVPQAPLPRPFDR